MLRLAIVACVAGCATASSHKTDHKHHRFDDATAWSRVFDDPARDAWQKPDDVVAWLKLSSTARVADIGAGTGYFAERLARVVTAGVVYAEDIEPAMVRFCEERAKKQGLANLHGVLGTAGDARLPEPVDLILVVDTYHHIDEPAAYFAKLRDRLRPGGRLVIVDFRMGDIPVGPPEKARVAPAIVAAELAKAGYVVTRKDERLLPHQYLIEVTLR